MIQVLSVQEMFRFWEVVHHDLMEVLEAIPPAGAHPIETRELWSL